MSDQAILSLISTPSKQSSDANPSVETLNEQSKTYRALPINRSSTNKEQESAQVNLKDTKLKKGYFQELQCLHGYPKEQEVSKRD